jgi:LmbE family N-acetylglucosaminyl deacetylase
VIVLLAGWPQAGRASAAPEEHFAPTRITAHTRAVIVSPHPDDGVLGAGGLIQRIVGRHGSVEIVEVTSGDAFPKGVAALRQGQALTPDKYRWYGTVREHEELQAMRQLGVGRSRIRLLGFPDEGMCQLVDSKTRAQVFSSPYTQRDSPPATERLVADAKYRGDDAQAEFRDFLLAFRPTLIILPDGRDEHPDHCATAAAADVSPLSDSLSRLARRSDDGARQRQAVHAAPH